LSSCKAIARFPVERPERVVDESHAKAIARGWITHGEFLQKENMKSLHDSHQKLTRNSFIRGIKSLEHSFGDLIVNRRVSDSSSKVPGKKPRYIELAYLSQRLSLPFHKSKLLPINLIVFDTKGFNYCEPVTCFNLSEHLLARIITRSNASSLKDIALWVNEFYLHIMAAAMHDELPNSDFTLLTHDSIIPFTYMDEMKSSNGLIAKTWIPRSEWTANTLKKFQPCIEALGDKKAGIIRGSTRAEKI
tara:strand:+ start:9654 stop:10394 length:741 start_codon:yes stop_codon:yes gene_type:complete